jgi:ATP-dependent DNA ligase
VDRELIGMDATAASFDALQLRLHPAASRILRLSTESPAALVLFDMLATPDGRSLTDAPLGERRRRLEAFVASLGPRPGLRLSEATTDAAVARGWLARSGAEWDGVMAKRLDAPYLCGERVMLKIKRIRTADCVVGGFRYATDGKRVGSLLLGLYDAAGRLDHVGFTSAFAKEDRPALTRRLEALVEAPGFTGRSPGGPSRWSSERSRDWQPLRSQLVVEVEFDHTTADRFRHGTRLVRWRPDKDPRDCTMEQLRG